MMQFAIFLVGILAAHWLGDFVLQSDWMGQNKSKSFEALLAHVGVYMAVLMVATPIILRRVDLATAAFVAFNSIVHLAVDFVTSRGTTWLYKRERRHDFFVLIGFDQWIHHSVLILTLAWLLQ